jgi:hypothetical protein
MEPRRIVLLAVGGLLLALAMVTFMAGVGDEFPLVVVFAAVVGALALAVALFSGRSAAPDQARTADPARERRRARAALIALGAMGLIALGVAVAVPVGEARGHAVAHLLTGVVALLLFAALGLLWHPRPGTVGATLRVAILVVLAVGVFGSFLESLGGAGYDAANAEPRIEPLAALHGVALPIAAFGLPAIPLGALIGLVVLATWAIRRRADPGAA